MNTETTILIIGLVLGSNVLVSIVSGLFGRRKNDADAIKVLQGMWHADLDRLKARVCKLEEELCGREAIIEKLMDENRQLRAELEELKKKYEVQLQENRRLGDRIRTLTKENTDLESRIAKLERAGGDQ